MTRLTISTDNPDVADLIKQIIAVRFRITKVKGPKVSKDSERLNYYINLGQIRRDVNIPR